MSKRKNREEDLMDIEASDLFGPSSPPQPYSALVGVQQQPPQTNQVQIQTPTAKDDQQKQYQYQVFPQPPNIPFYWIPVPIQALATLPRRPIPVVIGRKEGRRLHSYRLAPITPRYISVGNSSTLTLPKKKVNVDFK